MRRLSKADFLKEYGHRPDTAAKRKALAEGVVPQELIEPLEVAIDQSGVPLTQTSKGWGVQEVFTAMLAAVKSKKR